MWDAEEVKEDILFQFQDGAIKSPKMATKEVATGKFQFQDGAIKRFLTLPPQCNH